MKKSFIYIFIISLFFIPSIVKADNLTESVDNSKKVYDFANLITDEEEKEVYSVINKYIDNFNLDLAIVTIDNNPYGNDIESTKTYAIDFYNYNDFGIGNNKSGLVIVIDKYTDNVYLNTFGDAQKTYDSQQINSINNSISTFVAEENYYQIMKVYVTKLTNYAKYEDEEELMCNDENDNKYKCLVEKVDNSKKVYDFANLLTDDEEKELYNLAQTDINDYNMDLALVTISENPYGVSDYYSKVYAQDFYYYNRFGIGQYYDGIILLIDMSNRYIYMATKGNAIILYDDNRIDNITEAAYSYLKAGNYFQGYKAMINKAISYAKDGVPKSNKYQCLDETGTPYQCKTPPKSVNWGITLAVAFLGSVVPMLIHTRKYRGIRLATNANSYLTSSNVDTKTDQFLTTFTSRIRRSHDSGGSGGHSGGSTISHGSGGSFGGGGRHF